MIHFRERLLWSKIHKTRRGDCWWFSIASLGASYRRGDEITFRMGNYRGQAVGRVVLPLDDKWFSVLEEAPKDSKGRVHVHVYRGTDDNAALHFGPLATAVGYPMRVTLES